MSANDDYVGEISQDPAVIEIKQNLGIDLNDPLTSIPYGYIGNNIRDQFLAHGYSSDQAPISNYYDFYRLTPAYKLKLAGLTGAEQREQFFSNGPNGFGARVKRWCNEKNVLTFSDGFSKVASIMNILLFLLTLILIIWPAVINAKSIYESTDGKPNNHVATLNKLYWPITILKLAMAAIPPLVYVINVYKRTTIPRGNVEIQQFNPLKIGNEGNGSVFSLDDASHKYNKMTKVQARDHSIMETVPGEKAKSKHLWDKKTEMNEFDDLQPKLTHTGNGTRYKADQRSDLNNRRNAATVAIDTTR